MVASIIRLIYPENQTIRQDFSESMENYCIGEKRKHDSLGLV
jgi:hypothetical protein